MDSDSIRASSFSFSATSKMLLHPIDASLQFFQSTLEFFHVFLRFLCELEIAPGGKVSQPRRFREPIAARTVENPPDGGIQTDLVSHGNIERLNAGSSPQHRPDGLTAIGKFGEIPALRSYGAMFPA